MTGQRYARGSRALGECARSGKRLLLRDMVEDPLTGLMVDPDWAEPPLMRPPEDIYDGVALDRPAPDLDRIPVEAFPGTGLNPATGEPFRPCIGKFYLGQVRAVAT